MKKHFITGLLVLVTMSINAQIKTYSGAYSFGNKTGKATYQYTDVDEGRSYNGVFKGTTEYITITGNYTQNMKNGLWKIVQLPNWNYSSGLETTTLNFQNGKLSGEYHYINTMSKDKNKQNTTKIDASYLDNHFIGVFHYYEKVYHLYKNPLKGLYVNATPEITECIGQFDNNGYATGKWIFKKTDDKGLSETKYNIFNTGVLTDSYGVDNSTGVKEIYYSDKGVANSIFNSINYNKDLNEINGKRYYFRNNDFWIRIKDDTKSIYNNEIIIDFEIKELNNCWYGERRLEEDILSRGQEKMTIYPIRQLIID
jgi:hypothetical protein